jgi:hypothetical protein
MLEAAMTTVQVALSAGILINNSRLSDLRAHMDSRFDDMLKHLEER